jgi:hypothetical protein
MCTKDTYGHTETNSVLNTNWLSTPCHTERERIFLQGTVGFVVAQ